MKLKTGVVAITYERVKEDSIHHILKKEKGRGGGGEQLGFGNLK